MTKNSVKPVAVFSSRLGAITLHFVVAKKTKKRSRCKGSTQNLELDFDLWWKKALRCSIVLNYSNLVVCSPKKRPAGYIAESTALCEGKGEKDFCPCPCDTLRGIFRVKFSSGAKGERLFVGMSKQ